MKIAVIGSAGHWRLALDALARPDLEWSIAPTPGAPAHHGVDWEAHGARTYSDYRSLLDTEKPDVAVVNPPFHQIARVTRECLRRGVHVLSEKPLATEWDDLRELRGVWEAGQGQGVKLMAMLTMRYDPAFVAGRRFLERGVLGAPVLISSLKSYPLMGWDGGPRPEFFHRRATYGGTIPWIGIHTIDLIKWYSGSEFTEVHASHTRQGNENHGEMESAALLQFKLASGVLANAELDFLRRRGAAPPPGTPVASNRPTLSAPTAPGPNPPVAVAQAGALKPWGEDRLRVACEKGVLEIRQDRLFQDTDERGHREVTVTPDLLEGAQPSLFNAFLDWVEKGYPMLLSTEDCFRATEAALLARDSADEGRTRTF